MRTRVTVVGGGIIGASIAWRLAQRGAAVTLFDKGKLGNEASWAGAGMLAPGGELADHASWRDLALESHRDYPAFVQELELASGLAIDYRACGAIELALDPEHWDELRRRAARQRDMGIASEEITRAELEQRVPEIRLNTFSGALWYPGDALVDPRHVMAALRVTLTKLGVQIIEDQPVTRLPIDGEPLVLAAGAWSTSIDPTLLVPQAFPIRGHLTGYHFEPGRLEPILRHHHTYLLQRSNGYLIAGTSEEHAGFDRSIDPVVEDNIRARAEALLPYLKGRRSETWTGFRPAAQGLTPVVGRIPGTGLWLAYGHYRNGILMAPGTASRIAVEMADAFA